MKDYPPSLQNATLFIFESKFVISTQMIFWVIFKLRKKRFCLASFHAAGMRKAMTLFLAFRSLFRLQVSKTMERKRNLEQPAGAKRRAAQFFILKKF